MIATSNPTGEMRLRLARRRFRAPRDRRGRALVASRGRVVAVDALPRK
jgi:hypothetical protein